MSDFLCNKIVNSTQGFSTVVLEGDPYIPPLPAKSETPPPTANPIVTNSTNSTAVEDKSFTEKASDYINEVFSNEKTMILAIVIIVAVVVCIIVICCMCCCRKKVDKKAL